MNMRRLLSAASLALLPALGACGLLDTEAPGRIADDDLNSKDAITGLVTGMEYDLAQSIDGTLQFIALASGELYHGGSYDWADIPRGVILDEDVNGEWGTMQQARWVAENGIERIRGILDETEFGSSAAVARAYMFAGLANRYLGENLCATAIDGGPKEPNTVHFDRAIEQFTQAIQIGQAAGAQDVVYGAYGGRASVKAWSGDWAGAVADAQQVPDAFVLLAPLSLDGESNDLAYETHDRPEYSVWGTEWEAFPGDPRAPWDIIYEEDGSVATGANGSTPFYQQNKYVSTADDVPMVKGTEMLVLRAEAALRNNDIAGAFDLMNQARAIYGMAPLPVAPDMTAAWQVLHSERGLTTWLENRRFWDERRWFEESGPAHFDFLNGRDKCIPISREEKQSNPAARG